MRPAQHRLNVALQQTLPAMRSPRCAVYFSSLGVKVNAGAPPQEIVDALSVSLVSSVQWYDTFRECYRDGIDEFLELSPDPQLRSWMKKAGISAWKRTTSRAL